MQQKKKKDLKMSSMCCIVHQRSLLTAVRVESYRHFGSVASGAYTHILVAFQDGSVKFFFFFF